MRLAALSIVSATPASQNRTNTKVQKYKAYSTSLPPKKRNLVSISLLHNASLPGANVSAVSLPLSPAGTLSLSRICYV